MVCEAQGRGWCRHHLPWVVRRPGRGESRKRRALGRLTSREHALRIGQEQRGLRVSGGVDLLRNPSGDLGGPLRVVRCKLSDCISASFLEPKDEVNKAPTGERQSDGASSCWWTDAQRYRHGVRTYGAEPPCQPADTRRKARKTRQTCNAVKD